MAHFRDQNVPVRLGAAAYRDVVDGDQNQVRPAGMSQLARIDQHNSPAEAFEIVLDYEVLDHSIFGQDVFKVVRIMPPA
jgi:hypothetical protein